MLTKTKAKRGFFFLSLLSLIFFGSHRAGPIYGKLDFLLLDSKPWWPAWKPMIEDLLNAESSKPILSDPMTSTVMRGVFGQETIHRRTLVFKNYFLVEKWDELNNVSYLPPGALILLLSSSEKNKQEVKEIMYNYASLINEKDKSYSVGMHPRAPYRCVINMMGFIPSWVPFETNHWQPKTADTKWFYRYHYTHVKDLRDELEKLPPQNCSVFY